MFFSLRLDSSLRTSGRDENENENRDIGTNSDAGGLDFAGGDVFNLSKAWGGERGGYFVP